VDQFQKRLPKVIGWGIMLSIALSFTISFIFFADFSFGMQGSASNWKNREWLPQWNISSK
jgi:dolichyl-phosphate-mannose--protein O-mannosyl transferase